MRYHILIRGLISMTISTNFVIGSELLDKKQNEQISQSILQKIQYDVDSRKLTEEEKEWVYEINLLNSFKNLSSRDNSNPQDIYRVVGNLAEFYDYKGRTGLADKWYNLLAEKEISGALGGVGDNVGYLNEMIQRGFLNEAFFADIVARYQDNPNGLVKSKHQVPTEKLKEHIKSLVQAYRNIEQKAWDKRKEYGQPIIPLYDNVLNLELSRWKKKSRIY